MIRRIIFWFFLCSLSIAIVSCSEKKTTEPAVLFTWEGDGTQRNPYIISNHNDLKRLSDAVYYGHDPFEGKYFIMMNNIDLSDYQENGGWTSIGSASYSGATTFMGSFDGNGFLVTGLYIDRPYLRGGLFGHVEAATIINLGLSNIYIKGGNSTGGLVGQSVDSFIKNCYSTGIVISQGSSDVGGLIGRSINSTVSNCFSTAEVTGSSRVGGLIGSVTGDFTTSVLNSYSTGRITGFGGGLIGSISQSFVSNSYWNIETSGIGSTMINGLYGRTTSEMTFPYAENTYIDWEFDNIWGRDVYGHINDGYPYL